MALRLGLLSTAHMHIWSYAHAVKANPEVEIVGVYDDQAERGKAFAEKAEIRYFDSIDELLDLVDSVAICSENMSHARYVVAAAAKGKNIICEKPLAATREDGELIESAVRDAGVQLMVAFPCRYSPAFRSLCQRVEAGEIGAIKAICATNRGSCPFGWFVEKDKSGGGAMIDHVVHVADLLRVLLKEEPVRVQAQTSHNIYNQEWEDCAMVTIEFGSGIFATLDSSWSRPSTFKVWGDVMLTVVGEKGIIEVDLFGQGLDHYRPGTVTHAFPGYGSSLDGGLFADFVSACTKGTPFPMTAFDGMQAARVALAGYESVQSGQPVAVA